MNRMAAVALVTAEPNPAPVPAPAWVGRGHAFTEQEASDMGHVWPLWRQDVSGMLPKLFQHGR